MKGTGCHLDQWVGSEVKQIASQTACRALLGALQKVSNRLEKACFPDKVNRVNAVLLPPVDVLGGDFQAA